MSSPVQVIVDPVSMLSTKEKRTKKYCAVTLLYLISNSVEVSFLLVNCHSSFLYY